MLRIVEHRIIITLCCLDEPACSEIFQNDAPLGIISHFKQDFFNSVPQRLTDPFGNPQAVCRNFW